MTIKDRKLREIELENQRLDFEERKSKVNNLISGYCIFWNEKNRNGQYFTIKTDFDSLSKVTDLFILIDGEFYLIGKVKLSKDEVGILVEAELDTSNERNLSIVKTITALIENDLIKIKANPDIEKINHHYGDMVSENGHIKYWAIADIIISSVKKVPLY